MGYADASWSGINLLVGIAAGSDTTRVRGPVAKERAALVRELLLATARGVRQI